MINRINNKYSKILLTFASVFVIIFVIVKTYADDNLTMRQVRFSSGSTINYEFSFYTDSPKFHTKASGYEKYKGMETDSNMNSIIGTDRVKMQGYGNYEFKADTNLFSFIDYCYSKEPSMVMACAYRAGSTEANTWDYTKLMSYRDSAVNTAFFRYFWQNMSAYCSSFKDYQDEFFFKYYTFPATRKVGINVATMRSLQNAGESVKEYLTCLTSYIFSITPSAQVEGMTFGKGDVVPFLYYKDKKHANIDVRNNPDALMDIAKYAYVALIEGWCSLPTPYHLWENEYNWLFGNYDPDDLDYDLETLHQWYDETNQRYCKDKGRKGNNLLGSDIDHIIESDYSIGQQLEATEYYLRQVFNELGIDANFKETMARNELMAKYMMQHSNFDETIKDYNVTIKFMTENLQRGTHEPQNTHTVVTSDFQTLEFPYTMDKRNVNHSDEDGISDGQELGNEKWINITAFVKRTYEDAVRNGQPHKATFEEQVEDIIEKNGAYTDINGNLVYGSVKWNDDKTKVLYRVYDYKSNPKLNDSDFDGLWDNRERDEYKLNNKFSGTSTEIGKVEYNQDFRWFYTNNKKYNDEVAVMSLIMSNLADGNTVSTDQASGDIRTYLTSIGFSNIQNIGEGSDSIYIAKKTIQYYDNKKDVIGVFFGKCDKWLSEIIKHKEMQKVQTTNVPFKESIESYIDQIVNKINLLDASDCCYWVAGYGVGGSLASEVASKLVDTSKEVYCYTFGAFNTRDKQDTKNEIKNIRNEDDFFVKYITGTKSGQNYGASIYEDLMWEYRNLTGNSNYKGHYIGTNYLLYVYDKTKFVGIESEETMLAIFDDYLLNFNRVTNYDVINDFADLCILMDKWADGNKQAHSIKSYYVLAKSINGFDLLDENVQLQDHYARQDEGMVFAFTGTETIRTEEDMELDDPRNGYKFNMKKDYEISNKSYNNSGEDTVRIKDYMYSNYTLKCNNPNEYKDVNYVKFWYDGNRNIPVNKYGIKEKLYDYKAGNISENTKFTYGSPNKKDKVIDFDDNDENSTTSWKNMSNYKEDAFYVIKNYIRKGGTVKKGTEVAGKFALLTINNRILAAFPSALFYESFDKTSDFYLAQEKLNLYTTYGEPKDGNNTDGGAYKDFYGSFRDETLPGIIPQKCDMYRLVDVVIEDENNQQFVIPFISIDAKNIHLLPNYGSKKGMFATLTDNRYGQVMEEIYDENPITYNYYKYHINTLNMDIWFPQDMALVAEKDILNGHSTYTNLGKMITYYDREIQRKKSYISPIEPYIYNPSGNESYTDIVTKIVCGKKEDDLMPNYRIVSMRVYDERCAEDDGTPITGTWEDRQEEIRYKPDFYERLIREDRDKKNIIVKYK